MRTLVLRTSDNSINVNYKVDLLLDEQENFTVMDITGLEDAEVIAGIDFRELNFDLESFKKFAEDNNLLLDSIDTAEGGGTTAIVSSVTALNITTSSLPNGGNPEAVQEVRTVQAIADVSGSLDGKWFKLFAPDQQYYVWINVDSGGNDPLAPGQGIAVPIASDASANTVAAAIDVAVKALADFDSSVSTDTATITNERAGNVTDAIDANSGFTIVTTVAGVNNIYDEVLAAEGGNGIKTWTLDSGTLPPGLVLLLEGRIIGEPHTVGSPGTFVVKVTDAFAVEDTQTLEITIDT